MIALPDPAFNSKQREIPSKNKETFISFICVCVKSAPSNGHLWHCLTRLWWIWFPALSDIEVIIKYMTCIMKWLIQTTFWLDEPPSNLQIKCHKHTYDCTFYIHSASYYFNHWFCLITTGSSNNITSEIYLAWLAMPERVSPKHYIKTSKAWHVSVS